MLVEAPRTVIAKATQAVDHLFPNIDVRAAEMAETTPDVVGPLERWKGRPRENPELFLIGVLQRDNRPKEANVFGFLRDKEDLASSARHGHRDSAKWNVPEWYGQNCYVTPLRARSVRPCHSRGEPHPAFEVGIVFDQPGLVELIDLVEGQREPESDVTIESHPTVRLEQQRVQLHSVAEIRLMEVRVFEDAFAALAGHVKPPEQTLDCVGEYRGLGRPGP